MFVCPCPRVSPPAQSWSRACLLDAHGSRARPHAPQGVGSARPPSPLLGFGSSRNSRGGGASLALYSEVARVRTRGCTCPFSQRRAFGVIGDKAHERSRLCLLVADALVPLGCSPRSQDSCVCGSKTSCQPVLLSGLPGTPSSGPVLTPGAALSAIVLGLVTLGCGFVCFFPLHVLKCVGLAQVSSRPSWGPQRSAGVVACCGRRSCRMCVCAHLLQPVGGF